MHTFWSCLRVLSAWFKELRSNNHDVFSNKLVHWANFFWRDQASIAFLRYEEEKLSFKIQTFAKIGLFSEFSWRKKLNFFCKDLNFKKFGRLDKNGDQTTITIPNYCRHLTFGQFDHSWWRRLFVSNGTVRAVTIDTGRFFAENHLDHN